jgi:hypothetical protein
MADGEGWMTVTNKKKERERTRGERQKYISEHQAFRLQHDLDIIGLANVLLSTESRNLQEDGWVFERVLKNDSESEPEEDPRDTDLVRYMYLPIPNKWNDRALFSLRIVSS